MRRRSSIARDRALTRTTIHLRTTDRAERRAAAANVTSAGAICERRDAARLGMREAVRPPARHRRFEHYPPRRPVIGKNCGDILVGTTSGKAPNVQIDA